MITMERPTSAAVSISQCRGVGAPKLVASIRTRAGLRARWAPLAAFFLSASDGRNRAGNAKGTRQTAGSFSLPQPDTTLKGGTDGQEQNRRQGRQDQRQRQGYGG